jgi:hypothetical protein
VYPQFYTNYLNFTCLKASLSWIGENESHPESAWDSISAIREKYWHNFRHCTRAPVTRPVLSASPPNSTVDWPG